MQPLSKVKSFNDVGFKDGFEPFFNVPENLVVCHFASSEVIYSLHVTDTNGWDHTNNINTLASVLTNYVWFALFKKISI